MKLPQFHLRDFFWLVLVAAMGLAWWTVRSRSIEHDSQLAAQRSDLEKLGLELEKSQALLRNAALELAAR